MNPNNRQELRLMTYNMQVGICTQSRSQYYRQLWRHVLPPAAGNLHLLPIVRILRGHDLVAIQEADTGSFRTRSVNQLRFLAERAGYPVWHVHQHRGLQPLAGHGMGLLSRFVLSHIETHALPGRIAGRAAVIYRLGEGASGLCVVVTHLSLGRRDRERQLQRIHELVGEARHVILMGDLNCEAVELRQNPWLRERGFAPPPEPLPSYPSWQPQRQIDHILTTPEVPVLSAKVLPFCWSDHLPISMRIALPQSLLLRPATSEMPAAAPARPGRAATTAWNATPPA